MFDQWVEQVEEGKLVGVMMVDQSAAFYMVEVPIMLEKLRLLGLDKNSIRWMENYLTGRKQSVSVGGKVSVPLELDHGLAQGSILAPLLYILFTGDAPDLAHEHPISLVDSKLEEEYPTTLYKHSKELE